MVAASLSLAIVQNESALCSRVWGILLGSELEGPLSKVSVILYTNTPRMVSGQIQLQYTTCNPTGNIPGRPRDWMLEMGSWYRYQNSTESRYQIGATEWIAILCCESMIPDSRSTDALLIKFLISISETKVGMTTGITRIVKVGLTVSTGWPLRFVAGRVAIRQNCPS